MSSVLPFSIGYNRLMHGQTVKESSSILFFHFLRGEAKSVQMPFQLWPLLSTSSAKYVKFFCPVNLNVFFWLSQTKSCYNAKRPFLLLRTGKKCLLFVSYCKFEGLLFCSFLFKWLVHAILLVGHAFFVWCLVVMSFLCQF